MRLLLAMLGAYLVLAWAVIPLIGLSRGEWVAAVPLVFVAWLSWQLWQERRERLLREKADDLAFKRAVAGINTEDKG